MANAPLKRVAVSMEGLIDTQAKREGPAVFESAKLHFEIAGLPEAQAREIVETYKRH